MLPGGVTELVWHFLGHLRINEDIARDRIDYEQAAHEKPLDDYKTERPDFDSNPELDEFSTSPLPAPAISLFEDHFAGKHRLAKSLGAPSPDEDIHPLDRIPGSPIPRVGGGGGGGGHHHEIKVVYQDGGEQSEVHIRQLNLLSDNDVLVSGDVTSSIAPHVAEINADASSIIHQMADEANAAIPSEWWIAQNGQGVTAFVADFDQQRAEHGGQADSHSVTPGYYLNGELQTSAPPPPDPVLGSHVSAESADIGGGHGLGVTAVAGNNVSFNGGVIVDLGESGRTMIVKGDYFHTDAIFQTNSTIDHDRITAQGADPSAIQHGADTADNIADFIQHPGVYDAMPATYAGPQWHVDVVHGDYYDVHTFVQTNFLLDNDIITQNGGDNHQVLVTGGNEQGNLAQLFDGSIHYDLIVVAGAYHGINVIFQNNILLDNDDIALLNAGLDRSQSVAAGDNQLLNAATIENFGNDKFQPMTDGLNGLLAQLANGNTSLDPATGNLLPGTGGTFDVLYITGDYYDVNAIWQTNVVSDVDVLAQLLGTPSPEAAKLHPDDHGSQTVVTGQNALTNEAVIADVGPTNAYVGGQVYGDTILVQANLVPTDLDHGLVKDTSTLVPELIAFVGETQDHAPAPATVVVAPAHDDAIASVMH
jgi:hypothetical protein